MYRLLLAVALSSAVTSVSAVPVKAQQTGKKVALLVGVNKYLKPGFRTLDFAEADVTAVGAELDKLGFQVTILLGSEEGDHEATKANIEACARKLVEPLGQEDLALVMLSGHGQQLNPTPDPSRPNVDFGTSQSYYCPVDARVNRPESQVALSLLLDDILAPNVGKKLLIVDACRDVPVDATRGARNTKGIEGRVVALPEDTGVFFSCRAGQMSFERHELGHGLFTYCVLEGLRGSAVVDGELAWNDLVAHASRRMAHPEITKYMPEQLRQVPIQAGAMPHTVLGKLDVLPVATTPTPRPTVPTNPNPAPTIPVAGSLDGKQAGEVRSFTDLGVKFCWCPAGSFTMGSPASEEGRRDDETQVNVTLSRGFWLGQTEVTQGLWRSVMGTSPWSGLPFVTEGPTYPATFVYWDDATEFCRKLTSRERAAGRLPSGWSYQLPTEAQWEYACRAGTTSPYNGDGKGVLSDLAWYDKNTWDIGEERYARQVGQKKPNSWGLLDMHGNVWEWCQDWYVEKLPGGADPLVSTTAYNRVSRGGSWRNSAECCRSAGWRWFDLTPQGDWLGFRLILSPSVE